MSSNFFKAINEANLSVTRRSDGSRQFGRSAHMDREDDRSTRGSYNNRGRSRGRYRGRSGGLFKSITVGLFDEVTLL